MPEVTVVVQLPAPAGSWERWRGECECGWRGEPRLTRHVARGEALEHGRVCTFQLRFELAA